MARGDYFGRNPAEGEQGLDQSRYFKDLAPAWMRNFPDKVRQRMAKFFVRKPSQAVPVADYGDIVAMLRPSTMPEAEEITGPMTFPAMNLQEGDQAIMELARKLAQKAGKGG